MIERRAFMLGIAGSLASARSAIGATGGVGVLSIEDFGADLHSPGADHTKAFLAAIASKKRVLVPALPGRAYKITEPLIDMGGANIVGAPGARLNVGDINGYLQIGGSGSSWTGLQFEPRQVNRAYGIILNADASHNRLSKLSIINGESGIRIEGSANLLEDISFSEMLGTSIRLQGEGSSKNIIQRVRIRNGALAGILHDGGAHHNVVRSAKKWVDGPRFTALIQGERGTEDGFLGGDICAYAQSSHHNAAFDLECANARDGCYTSSGDFNTLDGAVFTNGMASAVAISGSNNAISNVRAIGCKTGFRIIPQAGGLAKDNTFTNCLSDRAKEFGFRQDGNAYRPWQAGVTKRPPTHFCSNGLAIYRCAHATTEFGTRAPTHTEGTQSDGLNQWTFVAKDPSTLDADRNRAVRCQSRNSGTADWASRGEGSFYREGCPGFPDGRVPSNSGFTRTPRPDGAN